MKFKLHDKVERKYADIYIKRHKTGINVEIKVDFDRIERGMKRAQFLVDNQVMADMEQYMPQDTGTFIQVTRGMSAAIAGSGKVIAAAPPTGRFLYHGKVMVDPETNSPWARQGAKKVLTNRSLVFSRHTAVPKWFEPTKAKRKDVWVKIAKKNVGKGG